MLRIGVLSDDRLFSAGLLRILESEPAFTAFDEAPADGRSAAIGASDVLLLDTRMEGALGICAALKRDGGPKVIVVAAPDDDAWAPEALGAGARGILPKSAGAEDLVKAIHVVHDGLIWARRRVIVAWVDTLTRSTTPPGRGGAQVLVEQLSSREQDVFRHAAAGLGNREVARRLAISQATVKVHLTRIFQKLGLRSRGELAAAYHGIAPPLDPFARRTLRHAVPAGVLESRGAVRAPQPLRRSS
jgi:DNA-binding NarL/FixJ family response regulator